VTVEAAVPENDAAAAGAREPFGRGFGIEYGAVVLRRPQRDVLVDPLVAAVGIDRRERFLNEPRHAAGDARIHEVGRGLAPQPIVFAPRRQQEHPERRVRDVGDEVDDRVMAGDGADHGVAIEQVDLDGGGAVPLQLVASGLRACDTGHLMRLRAQHRHQTPSDHAGRASHEYFHVIQPFSCAPAHSHLCRRFAPPKRDRAPRQFEVAQFEVA